MLFITFTDFLFLFLKNGISGLFSTKNYMKFIFFLGGGDEIFGQGGQRGDFPNFGRTWTGETGFWSP